MTLVVLGRWLLVAEKTRHGRISGAMGHALVAVDEDRLGLDDDVLFDDQALVLEILQRVFRLVQLLLQGVADPHQLMTFTEQAGPHKHQNHRCNLVFFLSIISLFYLCMFLLSTINGE